MLAGWKELDRRFTTFGQHFQEDANLHDQKHAILEAENIAEWIYRCLAMKIGEPYLSATNIRKLMIRKHDHDGAYLAPKAGLAKAQHQYFNSFVNMSGQTVKLGGKPHHPCLRV
jgi:hypothetical protein